MEDMKALELNLPASETVRSELERVNNKKKRITALKFTIFSVVGLISAIVLIIILFTPVLKIHGTSMNPCLNEGDVVIAVKNVDLECGDLVAFYYGNNILVKRYIAGPGQWVNIDEDGNVYVNNQLLEEPYLTKKALGQCDIKFPYQVPENRIFCLGDQRETSVDSRSSTVGVIPKKNIVGKIFLRVWPMDKISLMN